MADHHQISPLIAAVLAVAFLLPALVSASRGIASKSGFVVQGRVFCDTCRAGFETPYSTYIEGAKVKVECRLRSIGSKTCSFEGVTDHTGTFRIPVANEHEHEDCEAIAISSPQSGCATSLKGRQRAGVFLTHNNGISTDIRFANALGFEKDTPLAGCAELLKTYELNEV